MPATAHPIIVVAWIKLDGSEPTDQKVLRDGCYRTVYKTVPAPRSVIWSSDGYSDQPRAMAYAEELRRDPETVDATAYVYPATEPEPLERARKEIMAAHMRRTARTQPARLA